MSGWKQFCYFMFFVLKTAVLSADNHRYPSPQTNWDEAAQTALREALNVKQNNNVAKNVILFLGDGMGVSTVTAGRIYGGQKLGKSGEEYQLAFDTFPNVALSKTYNTDRQVADSAGTATAFLCGVKARMGTIGVNQNVRAFDCPAVEGNEVKSILHHSSEAGKRTGIVTTARVTHATPAAAYAHSPFRYYEGNVLNNMTIEREKCTDIATQLVRDNPNINVILGGGRSYFVPKGTQDPEYPNEMSVRNDYRNLIEEWMDEKKSKDASHAYVWNQTGFNHVDPSTTDYLLGLFQPSHMQYEIDRQEDTAGEPSLAELVGKAIDILSQEPKGYFLLVEGGRIDHGHHDNLARKALEDTVALSDAVQKAMDLTNEEDTLMVVTADHSHVFTLGGYAPRGNPILGIVGEVPIEPALDGLPYTTIIYGNGPGAGTPRAELLTAKSDDKNYAMPAAVATEYETHGGEDVAIYARGPLAHLFHTTHEQNYIAHVMAYASCVGSNKQHCLKQRPAPEKLSNSATYYCYELTRILLFAALVIILI